MSNITIEQMILRNLMTDDEYMRKVLPFLQPDYFDGVYNSLFKEMAGYVATYNKLPTIESLKIEMDNSHRFSDEHYAYALEILPMRETTLTLFTKDHRKVVPR